jgi:hypothetical protein
MVLTATMKQTILMLFALINTTFDKLIDTLCN